MQFTRFPALTMAAMLAVGAGSAQAVEVTGGSVGLSYSAFTEDTDFNRLGLEGSMELGLSRNFGLQLDAAYHDFGFFDIDSTLLGLHGIYHMDEATSFGVFYTRESAEGEDADMLGVELGHEVRDWDFEGYIGSIDTSAGNAMFGGIQARYETGEGLGITASYDRGDEDDSDVSRFAVRLDRDVSPTTNLFLEVGTANVDAGTIDVSEPFVGLGGKIAFGAARGATFEQRGLARLIPGL